MKIGPIEVDLVDVGALVGGILAVGGLWWFHPGLGIAVVGIILVVVVVWIAPRRT